MMRHYFALLVTGSLLLSAALPQAAIASSYPQGVALTPKLPEQTAILYKPAPAPNVVTRRVKQAIAKQFKVPTRALKVVATEARTWNGCFGLPAPNRMCTAIAIEGYQVIVEGQQRRWVYHTNANGSQLAFNEAASLIKPSQIAAQFIEQDEIIAPDQDVVYQAIDSGGFAGRTVITRLLNNGVISQQQVGPTIRSRPVVLKQIKPQQVEAFLEQVRQTRFNHLNRLSYSPVRQGADFITTQVTSEGSVTQYVDYIQAELPSALQQTIKVWQTLLKS